MSTRRVIGQGACRGTGHPEERRGKLRETAANGGSRRTHLPEALGERSPPQPCEAGLPVTGHTVTLTNGAAGPRPIRREQPARGSVSRERKP